MRKYNVLATKHQPLTYFDTISNVICFVLVNNTNSVLPMTMSDVKWLSSYITVHVDLSVPDDIYEYKLSLALVTFGYYEYDHTIN